MSNNKDTLKLSEELTDWTLSSVETILNRYNFKIQYIEIQGNGSKTCFLYLFKTHESHEDSFILFGTPEIKAFSTHICLA